MPERPHAHRIITKVREHVGQLGHWANTQLVIEQLAEFILSEIAEAEKRGQGCCMNPEGEQNEQHVLRRIFRLLERIEQKTRTKVSRWLVIVRPLEPIEKKDKTGNG